MFAQCSCRVFWAETVNGFSLGSWWSTSTLSCWDQSSAFITPGSLPVDLIHTTPMESGTVSQCKPSNRSEFTLSKIPSAAVIIAASRLNNVSSHLTFQTEGRPTIISRFSWFDFLSFFGHFLLFHFLAISSDEPLQTFLGETCVSLICDLRVLNYSLCNLSSTWRALKSLLYIIY